MLFSALASIVISCAVVHSCIVFCNAVLANRIVVVASRSPGIMAACVILLVFAAEHRKLYWNGCKKVAMVIFQ